MKNRSAKQKGIRLVEKVAEIIKQKFSLGDQDVVRTPNSVNGVDIYLSTEALGRFPYAIECKNSETLNIWKAIEQAESNEPASNQRTWTKKINPLIIFSKNRKPIYVCLKLDDFLDLFGVPYFTKVVNGDETNPTEKNIIDGVIYD